MKVMVILVFLALAGGMLWLRFSVAADFGEDFTAFYLAGKLAPQSLYDQAAFQSAGAHWLAPQGIHYYPPYIRPAVFALPLRVLPLLPYRPAFMAWMGILFAAYIGTIAVAFRLFRPPFYVLGVFGAFYPAIVGPTVGQDASIEALLVAASLALLITQWDVAAGALLACGLYKFNLIMLLPLVLVAHSRYRALVAFCACGALLAAASAVLSPVSAYLTLLQHIGATSAVREIFRATAIQWLYIPLVGLTAIATFVLAKRLPLEQGFCVALIASYLFAYKVAWYDAVILVVPLVAAFRRDSPQTSIPALFLLLPILWQLFPTGTVCMLLVLFAGFALPAITPVFENWKMRNDVRA